MSRSPSPDHDLPLPGLADAVARLLPRYGLAADADVSLLNVSENITLRAADAGGGAVIIRVHRPGYHTRDGIVSELDWLAALAQSGVIESGVIESGVIEAVVPLADDAGERVQTLALPDGPRHAVLFQPMSGVEPSPDDDLEPWFERLGGITARLHAHARDWQRPAGFTRQVWDTSAMHGPVALWGPWQAALGLERQGAALIGRTVDHIAAQLAAYGQGPDRFGLIHADLRLSNLLMDGERLKVLDFDDCGLSWTMYDFAAAVSFYEHLPNVPALREAWLAGYQRLAPLSPDDVAILPTLVMARRILLMAWIASHQEAPFPRSLGAGYTHQSLALAESYLTGRFLR